MTEVKLAKLQAINNPLRGESSHRVYQAVVVPKDGKTTINVHLKVIPMKEVHIEAFCAQLAYRLNLQVPDAYITQVKASQITTLNEDRWAFCSQTVDSVPLLDAKVLSNIDKSSLPMAIFDEMIGNEDRHYSNVLVDDKNKIRWYIDH